MNAMKQRVQYGVTLIEMLLVMVVVSAIIVMGIGYVQQRTLQLRIDKVVTTSQQILNAALAYYVANNSWPASISCLQGLGGSPCNIAYLPANLVNSFGSAGSTYTASPNYNNSPNFWLFITVDVGKNVYAVTQTIAGKLPLSSTMAAGGGACVPGSTNCVATTQVNIPGQNLNNAASVNFAGLYHNGACVPAPSCPLDANNHPMQPEIMVVPASVTGANAVPTGPDDAPTPVAGCNATDTSQCSVSSYPLTSFTARAIGPGDSTALSGCASSLVEPCYGSISNSDSGTVLVPSTAQTQYYRVCLSVTTEYGQVVPSTDEQGLLTGTVMVITRCKPNNQDTGSDFTVFSN